jgi:RNA-directed DNA polymerase
VHENRETSRVPAGAGRSGKASGHNPDVFALEESDHAIVPMKQPNNTAKPVAEAAEGRVWTKKNDAQSDTSPTQSGERVPQGLGGVRRVARERKQEQFTALLHHLTVQLLRDSYYALKRNAAPGIDGVSWSEYENGLEDRLADLHGRVHRGAYRAHPSRRVYIPKADGRRRQRGRPGWNRIRPTFERWIPRPRALHPYPNVRFDATHSR